MSARNPEQGVPRRLESTYGFLTREIYKPSLPTHQEAVPFKSPVNGTLWVEVIENFMAKVSLTPG